ncbi:carbonic anhydrase [Methanobacterium sp.]|uniref:carbonic anhydrase n=1 Tax=Methanobacterium sp. TaxID=2164 RepID=UPI003D657AEE
MTFATCLNCMDGRVQLPVIKWIMENYNIKYVDMITEPGMNGFLADKSSNIQNIIKKVQITVDIHDSENVFIVGHYDCVGNPVNDLTHEKHIYAAVNRIKSLFPDLNIVGLWVSEDFEVSNVIEK